LIDEYASIGAALLGIFLKDFPLKEFKLEKNKIY
jgi:hypothetical protein